MRISLSMLLLLVVSAGCQDPDEKVQLVDKTTGSWSSAVRLAIEDFEHGKVPPIYVKQILDAAQEDLTAARKNLKDVPETRRLGPEKRLSLLEARVRAMREALRSGRTDCLNIL